MRLNLIAEPSDCTQLPASVQCAPTYCILEPGSNRVAVGLKNISAKAITIPSRVVVGKLQQSRMVPDDKTSKFKQGPTGEGGLLDIRSIKFGGVETLTGEQQQSGRDLLVDSADVFSHSDLDLGKCNIINMPSKLQTPNLSRRDTEGSHLTSMRR